MVFDGPPEFGLGDQTLKGNNNAVNPSHGLDAEKLGFGDAGYYNGFSSSQDAAERGARRGTETRKMSRIDKPRTKSISASVAGRQMNDSDSDDNTVSVEKQMELEAGNEIQYRTCSWQKTAALLFSEYICLAIMSFPYSYSVLGLVPGIILTVVIAALVLYTSFTVWEFCMRHPEVKDVCDIGQMLFWGKKWAWYFTAVMFLLNNTFIQGFHCLVGSKYLNTMTNGGLCTVVFSAIVAIVSFFSSLPRTFDTLSKLAGASAFFTFVSVLLAAIFAAIEDHPGYGWPSKGAPVVLAVPASGTTFVAGMNAFMNISYTFIVSTPMGARHNSAG
ncbi:N amino acid transport system protein [Pseudocercospora fuligena]|uniref:N amino acid transport system protein n=1 Tax=Pseudocercospora fuligena TaxID=685502 RepID=A0A8H6RMR6_9PEZI|nr:N amino acid transport system protein [Pseudocercospora fuligena]